MSIAFKEGVRIPPSALNEIILAANQDVRQVNMNILHRVSQSGHLIDKYEHTTSCEPIRTSDK